MQVIILAGGRGTRLVEETSVRPKPMVEIGGKPILWHIMSIYAAHGFKDFILACGYKGEIIKEYFRNFIVHTNDLVIDLRTGSCETVNANSLDWRLAIIDTGPETQTGGRILQLRNWTGNETFMVTYGDGVGNVDVTSLVAFHRAHGRLATITAVRPPSRFGTLKIDGDDVAEFSGHMPARGGWINGGFFVFEPRIFDYFDGDETILEREPMERLAAEGQLKAFHHEGFWQPMDTLREKQVLESLWSSGKAPWKVW